MEVKGAWGLVTGGLCAWRLPGDESGPAAARRLLRRTMSELRLDQDVIEDGELAVSETATNALRHARCAKGDRPPTTPELWIWARTVPSPQLVVSVFDGARTTTPHASGAGLLDQHGKGLELVRQVTAAWGCAPTRSRVDTTSVPGKTVWFALPLRHDWPGLHYRVHPGTAAHHLLLNLTHRGFKGRRSTTEDGLSVLVLPTLNVWVHRRTFCWWSTPHRYLRRPPHRPPGNHRTPRPPPRRRPRPVLLPRPAMSRAIAHPGRHIKQHRVRRPSHAMNCFWQAANYTGPHGY